MAGTLGNRDQASPRFLLLLMALSKPPGASGIGVAVGCEWARRNADIFNIEFQTILVFV
jgi:hypothetical protein